MKNIFASFIMLTCLVLCASACSPGASEALQISEAWARPAATGENSAVYFVLENPSADADVLRSASADIAAAIELHISRMENNVMKMEHQEKVDLPANQTIEFAPGGLHVMLINLTKDLNVGDTFDLTLQFDQAGAKTIQVTVKEP